MIAEPFQKESITVGKTKIGIQPSINTDAVIQAMLLLADVKAGTTGRLAMAQAMNARGVYVKRESSPLPKQVQDNSRNPIIVNVADTTLLANLQVSLSGVKQLDDYAVFSKVNDAVDSTLSALANPQLPTNDLLNIAVETSVGYGAAEVLAAFGNLHTIRTSRRTVGKVGLLALAAIATTTASYKAGVGQVVNQEANTLVSNIRIRPNLSPLDTNAGNYNQVGPSYTPLVNSAYFKNTIARHLVIQTPVTG